MPHKFTYQDGTVVEFDDFEPTPNVHIQILLPPMGKSQRQNYGFIYVRPEDKQATQGYSKQADKDKIRVGILRDATKHPFPRGIYMPYKANQYYQVTHALDGLTGDFIFNENIKKSTVAAIV